MIAPHMWFRASLLLAYPVVVVPHRGRLCHATVRLGWTNTWTMTALGINVYTAITVLPH